MPRDAGIATTKLAIVSPADFSDAGWTKANVAVAANQESDPFGGNAGDLLTDTVTGVANHRVSQSITGMTGQATFGCLAKAGTISWLAILPNSGGVGVWFDVANGTVGTQASAVGSIRSFGGGWFFCALTFTASDTNVQIYLAPSNGAAAYAGTGAGTVRLYSTVAYAYGRAFTAGEVTRWHARSHVAGVY